MFSTGILSVNARWLQHQKLLAYWRFEQVQHLNGATVPATGQRLSAGDRSTAEPQPLAYDDSRNSNFYRYGSKPSFNVFSDNVPMPDKEGKPDTRSLALKWDGNYNVYAANAPGSEAEQICYPTAKKTTGPWIYGFFVTCPAKSGLTIHPAVIKFKKKWHFFFHDGRKR